MTKSAKTSETSPVFTKLVKSIVNEVLESKFMKVPIPEKLQTSG